MNYTLITDENALTALCKQARETKAVAIDTEFVRTKTLTPQLGLLQLFDGEQLALIDPLAIDDMSSFVALMQDQSVVKVLHSCSEDLETFLTAFGCIPSPVFDTQVAASILGLGATLGYAKLVELLCDKHLDKGESRTDWLARPLREAQLHYAANDVLYLLPAYNLLAERIQQVHKYDWVVQEIAGLAEKKRASIAPEFAYLQLKNTWRLNVEQLTVFRHLAAWRLSVARQKNIALNFVVRESQLFDIATKMPNSRSALSNLGLPPQTFRRYADTLLGLVQEARTLFEDAPPHLRLTRIKRLIDFPEYKKTMSAIKAVCADVAQQYEVGEDVIASKKQINQVLKWQWFDNDEYRAQGLSPDLVSGWRAALLKERIEAIIGPIKPLMNE